MPDDFKEVGDDDGEDYRIIKKEKKKEDHRVTGVAVEEPIEIDYDTFPQVSEELDDYEFKNYATLRSWRAKRCKELETEPYKICQNRTLCEMIRRRRNDENWGMGDEISKISEDLLLCWGIGASKVRIRTYGHIFQQF